MFDINNPAITDYIQLIDIERRDRWIRASCAVRSLKNFMMPTLQGLGNLDAKLVVEDAKIRETDKPSNPFGDLSDHITLSYLWILGAYEFVRALEQRAREDDTFFPEFKDNLRNLKHSFERIRIPLAKFEAARRHKDTDSHIAYPSFNPETGVGWQVAQDTWIDRRVLSDELLELLEQIIQAYDIHAPSSQEQ